MPEVVSGLLVRRVIPSVEHIFHVSIFCSLNTRDAGEHEEELS